MKRDVWRRLGKRFLARLAIPLAVVFVLLFVLELWTVRARAQAERAKPRKPEIDRRQQAPAPREFDRTLHRLPASARGQPRQCRRVHRASRHALRQ